MIESEGSTENVAPWRTDVVARIINAIGLETGVLVVDQKLRLGSKPLCTKNSKMLFSKKQSSQRQTLSRRSRRMTTICTASSFIFRQSQNLDWTLSFHDISYKELDSSK